jgi:hypothetical protein
MAYLHVRDAGLRIKAGANDTYPDRRAPVNWAFTLARTDSMAARELS